MWLASNSSKSSTVTGSAHCRSSRTIATGRAVDAMDRSNDSVKATTRARTRLGSAGGIGDWGPSSAANSGDTAVAIPALSPRAARIRARCTTTSSGASARSIRPRPRTACVIGPVAVSWRNWSTLPETNQPRRAVTTGRSSSIRAVLPTPDTPDTRMPPPSPSAAASKVRRSFSASWSRPIRRGVANRRGKSRSPNGNEKSWLCARAAACSRDRSWDRPSAL